jgi:Tat protein secretion system quality control protein TatD with DNase activity
LIFLRQILEVVAQIKNITEEELANIAYENTMKAFNLKH